jgi:hypothetical protein
MVETAKVQLATLNAGIEFWSRWVESASRFAQTSNTELAKLSTGDVKADETLSRMVDAGRIYLKAMTELPSIAVTRFNSDLEGFTEKKAEPARSAKAKE